MLASHEPWAPTDGDASSQGEIQQGGNAYEAGGGVISMTAAGSSPHGFGFGWGGVPRRAAVESRGGCGRGFDGAHGFSPLQLPEELLVRPAQPLLLLHFFLDVFLEVRVLLR